MYERIVVKIYSLFPESIREMLPETGFRKYFSNTSWLLITRIIGYAVSFFIIAVVARYLGPTNLGKLSYAQSFVSIFSVFASFGIDSILTRDLVEHPENQRSLLGTSFFIKAVLGILTFAVTLAVAYFTNTDKTLTFLIGIISLSFLFQPFSVISNLLSAKVLSKYYSYITIFLSFFLTGLKLLIVLLDKGIVYFATIFVVEAFIYALYYIFIYKKVFRGNVFQWRFKWSLAKKLLLDSWPLLLAGFSGYIYGRIDQVMLQHILGSTSVGLYDAAVKLTDVWSFLPGMIITSLFPAVISARKLDKKMYLDRTRYILTFITGITFFVSLIIFIIAPFLIKFLYGSQFIGSYPILRLYVWSSLATGVATIIHYYLVAENHGKKYFIISVIGAVINVILNILLIPVYGITGAAVATLVSYATVPLAIFFFKSARPDWLYILHLRKYQESK